MDDLIKVSIIIPTYRPKGYLWDCLNSIVNQTFDKRLFEVVLVLNGCNEPYHTEIKEYIKQHTSIRFVFIQTDKGGVSNARNIGIDSSNGEYIAFIDDDDYVSPTYIEELYSKASPDMVSICYPLSFNDGSAVFTPYLITQDYYKNEKDSLCHYKKVRRFFSGPVYKLIHKNIIGDRRFDIRFKNGEDSLFMFLISDRLGMVALTSRNAVYYRRIRKGSAVTKKKSKKAVLSNFLKLELELWKIYLKHPSKYNLCFLLAKSKGAIRGAIEQISI